MFKRCFELQDALLLLECLQFYVHYDLSNCSVFILSVDNRCHAYVCMSYTRYTLNTSTTNARCVSCVYVICCTQKSHTSVYAGHVFIDNLGMRSIQLDVSETLPQGSLACGSPAFIATLLRHNSMSALPIIETQQSQSVGLFTSQ